MLIFKTRFLPIPQVAVIKATVVTARILDPNSLFIFRLFCTKCSPTDLVIVLHEFVVFQV